VKIKFISTELGNIVSNIQRVEIIFETEIKATKESSLIEIHKEQRNILMACSELLRDEVARLSHRIDQGE